MTIVMKSHLLQIILQIDALLQDYMSEPFPESMEEVIVEFTEVAEEIQALIKPVVDMENASNIA